MENREEDDDIPLDQIDDIPESGWSESVAVDPKHRPQTLDKPSTTARREWLRWPQEAHLLDKERNRYRRLSVAEIARIQGFDETWVRVAETREKYQIAALGDAVPPKVAFSIFKTIDDNWEWNNRTAIEMCAGIGGLASGASAVGLHHLALVEKWLPACQILKSNKPWAGSSVFCEDVRSFDFERFSGKVGVLSGGPPCQPWSLAGQGKGSLDPRDLLGFLPVVLSQCQPEVFVIENVPGLVTKMEHQEYLESTLEKLANPGPPNLSYGIARGILNAADFGVPQKRQRLFILGFRDKSFTFANGIFNLVSRKKSHCDPLKPVPGRAPWVTLKEALSGLPDPGGWRTYVKKQAPETYDKNAVETAAGESLSAPRTACSVDKLEFTWPTKLEIPIVKDDLLTTASVEKVERLYPLLLTDHFPSSSSASPSSNLAVIGDELSALKTLRRLYGGLVQMVYFDSTPVDKLRVASHIEGFRNSLWMSIVYRFALATRPLLTAEGVFVLQVNDESYHYARIVLEEVFGPGNYVCTIVWQKKYSPQNDLDVPTDAQDYLIVFAQERAKLPPIGLEVTDELVDDGDPRGPWKAAHKGARSGTEETKFEVNVPPYRWDLVEGRLPPGLWRVSPELGVIWGIPREKGLYKFKVRVTDSLGAFAESQMSIDVLDSDDFEMPQNVWWMREQPQTQGPIELVTNTLKPAALNKVYTQVLEAKGGKPYVGKKRKPGPGRFWEFSIKNLVENILQDNVQFGKDGTSLPAIKKHFPKEGSRRIARQTTWWSWETAGKSEDASKHLKELENMGLIKDAPRIAKPEELLKRLILLFAPQKKSVILALGDTMATTACVSMKIHRPFVHLVGNGIQERRLWQSCARPRLTFVAEGKDKFETTYEIDAIRTDNVSVDRTRYFFDVLEVGKPIFSTVPHFETYEFDEKTYSENEKFVEAVCSVAGFRKIDNEVIDGVDLKGDACIVVPLDSSLTEMQLSRYVSEIAPKFRQLSVFFESSLVSDSVRTPANVFLRHIPFDMFGW